MSLAREQYWRFGCRRCKVHAIVCFPKGYSGDQVYQCPGCKLPAEVIEKPEATTEKSAQVTSMHERRQAQLLAEAVTAHPDRKGKS